VGGLVMGADVGYAGGGSEVIAMKSQPITLRGPTARGSTVSTSVLHRLLGVVRAHDPVLCASEAALGLAAIMGKWPGDESDEEIAEILERLS
jgi:predicted aconitase with swiveling domain